MESTSLFKNSFDESLFKEDNDRLSMDIFRNDILMEDVKSLNKEAEKKIKKKEKDLNPAQSSMELATSTFDDKKSFWRSDSFRMIQVKNNIKIYKMLFERTLTPESDFDAFKVGAVDILRETIRVCKEYTTARGDGGGDVNTRHGKVAALIETLRNTLCQIGGMTKEDYSALFEEGEKKMTFAELMLKDGARRDIYSQEAQLHTAEMVEGAMKRDHATLDRHIELFPKDRDLTKALSDYICLTRSDLPATEEEFNKQLEKIKTTCSNIKSILTRINKEGATFESSKIRRERANKLLGIFQIESRRLEKANFEKLNDKGILTFDGIWEGTERNYRRNEAPDHVIETFRVLDEKVMEHEKFKNKEGKYPAEFKGMFGNNMRQNIKNTEKMAALLKVKGLFSTAKDVSIITYKNEGIRTTRKEGPEGQKVEKSDTHYVQMTQKGFYLEEKGIKLNEALEIAQSEGLNLIYSNEALEQLFTIQIMDMICGQVNRDDDSFRVVIQKGSMEGENYYIIRNVMATNNEYSFGTAKFEDLNKIGETSSTRMFWNNKKKKMGIKVYNTDFADRILDLKIDEVLEQFPDLSEERRLALKDRIENVQRCLAEDKKEDSQSCRSQRDKLKAKATDPKKIKQIEQMYTQLYTNQFSWSSGKNTYVNPSLIKDYGNTEEFAKGINGVIKQGHSYSTDYMDVSVANEYVDDNLKSVKLRKEKLGKIQKIYDEDLNKEYAAKFSEEYKKIINGLTFYISLDMTAEKADKRSGENAKDILDEIKGIEFDEAFLQRISTMNGGEALTQIESYIVSHMKKKIAQRIADLSGISKDVRSAAQEDELLSLTKLKDLLSDTDGQLDISNIVIKDEMNEDKLTILDKDRKELSVANQNVRDDTDVLLFPHEPCIQDVCQGHLGNCYFLSAIAAIVEKDPGYIKRIMKDDGKGNVIVRLYKDKKPVYVKVKKTVPTNQKGNSSYARGSLWVEMLEKAYTVSAIHGAHYGVDKEKYAKIIAEYNKFNKDGKRCYSHIESGSASDAFKALLGKVQNDISTNQDRIDEAGQITAGFGDRRELYKDGTIEFNGDLSRAAIRLTTELLAAQRQNKIITIGSRNSLIASSDVNPITSEKMERGFASTHNYTFIGIEEKNGVYYARLRNPWGHGAVEAVRNPITGNISYRASETKTGTFAVDIYTLVIYFKNATITQINTK